MKTIISSIPYIRVDTYFLNKFIDLNEFKVSPVKPVLDTFAMRLLVDQSQSLFFEVKKHVHKSVDSWFSS